MRIEPNNWIIWFVDYYIGIMMIDMYYINVYHKFMIRKYGEKYLKKITSKNI